MKATELRRGSVIVYNNAPYRVIEQRHHTPGNLKAMIQTKLRNLLTGNQTDHRFGPAENVEIADVLSFVATYLYNDMEGYHFMNVESYEQIALSKEQLGENAYYLQEEMQVEITTYNGEPIDMVLPQTVTLTIAEADPELKKGSTATNSPKPAKTDTGLKLTVPQFVNVGDRVVVNTEEGKYLSRAE
jgi:elongation factor P